MVWVFLQPAAELRADRALLETVGLADPSLTVQVRCIDGDLIAMEVALRAADAWYADPAGTVAIVTDAGRLASVARHYEKRPGRRPPWLLHLHERPPRLPNRSGPATSSRRTTALPRSRSREVDPGDAGHGVARMAVRADSSVARRSLRHNPGGRSAGLEHDDREQKFTCRGRAGRELGRGYAAGVGGR